MQPQNIILAQAVLDFATDGERVVVAKRAQRDLAVVSSRIAKAKSGVGRSYVSTISKGIYPSDEYLRVARWLDDLSVMVDVLKADGQGVGTDKFEQWAERRVKRVGGRFARSTGTASPSSFSGSYGKRRAERLKSKGPALPGGLKMGDKGIEWEGGVPPSGDTQQRAEQWLGAQLAADELEGELKRAFGRDFDMVNLKLNIQDAKDPSKIHVASPEEYDPSMGQALSVGFDIDEHAMQSADAATKQKIARKMAIMQGMGQPGQTAMDLMQNSPFASALGQPGTLNNDRRSKFAGVAQAAGQTLQGFGPTAGIGSMLEGVGQLAGTPGAKAIEPYVERAAARYTGARVKPSQQIEEAFGQYSEGGARLEALRASTNAAVTRKELEARWSAAGKDPARHDPNDVVGMNAVDAAARIRMLDGQRKDQLVLGVQSDMAALALGQQLPKDPMLNVLSQKAGKTLPSRGVIIGADGEVAFESVGQADDHYTPFDARMLGALEGGQFVRTRQKGGPSPEDLRTMLSTGARMATVVSPSGVFELEMAPEARGMKRFGPQMQSMNDAYSRLLDTIASNALSQADGSQYLGELEGPVMAEISRKVAAISDPARAEAERKKLTTKAYTAAATKAAGVDREALYQESLKGAAAMSDQERNELTVQEYARRDADAKMRFRVRPLMLNGEGYNLALRTLQARFPHMIRTARYRDNQQFARDLGKPNAVEAGLPRNQGKDSGYLKPGQVKTFGGVDPRTEMERGEEPAAASGAGAGGGGGGPAAAKPKDTDGEPSGGAKPPEANAGAENKLEPDSDPVKLTMAFSQQAKNELRKATTNFASSLGVIGSEPEGWVSLLGVKGGVSGGEVVAGKFPKDYQEALTMRPTQAPWQTAVLYATSRLEGGMMDSLLDEMDSDESLRSAILQTPVEKVSAHLARTLPQTSEDGPKTDNISDLADTVADQVRFVATLHSVASPTFVPAPGDAEELAALGQSIRPLPTDLAGVSSVDEYVEWANSDDDLASDPGKSRVGRQLLVDELSGDAGLSLMEGLTDRMSELDDALSVLAKDLKGKNGDGEAHNVLQNWENPDTRSLIPKPVYEKLESTYEGDRVEGVNYLKGAIRTGLATLQLQIGLEVGGADPKALAARWPKLKIATLGKQGDEPHPAGMLVQKASPVRVRKSAGTPWRVLRQRVLLSA